MQLASHFIGTGPVLSLEQWCRKNKTKREISCPQTVLKYCMGRLDLADMLLVFYSLQCKTKKRYQKILWYLIDIAKLNLKLLHCQLFCILWSTKERNWYIQIKWQLVFRAYHQRVEDLLLHCWKEKSQLLQISLI